MEGSIVEAFMLCSKSLIVFGSIFLLCLLRFIRGEIFASDAHLIGQLLVMLIWNEDFGSFEDILLLFGE